MKYDMPEDAPDKQCVLPAFLNDIFFIIFVEHGVRNSHSLCLVCRHQIIQGSKMISHFLPLGQKFIQNLPICFGGAVKQDDGAG